MEKINKQLELFIDKKIEAKKALIKKINEEIKELKKKMEILTKEDDPEINNNQN